MKHSEIRARLSEFLERDLSPDERSQVDAHIETCTGCRSELEALRATVTMLRRLPEPQLPPGLGDAVIARIARGEGREARVYALVRRATEPRWIAPLAAGLAGLFFLVESQEPGLPTPTLASAPLVLDGLDASSGLAAFVRGSDEESLAGWREGAAAVRAGFFSGTTPAADYAAYLRRVGHAQGQEMARELRGVGHPYSASLASHFEPRSGVVLADWQPH